ncbi:MAG TPA: hypothetical protein PKV72_04100 [Candidatus Peribacteria bacterium]|nr:hypothetical protein [Candidatus Peribacteria bacterium]
MSLFDSTSASVTVRQNGREITGPKARRGYDFSIDCQPGKEVEVEFINRLGETSEVRMVSSAIDDTPDVQLAPNTGHIFRFTPTESIDQTLLWTGDRSAVLRFRVAAS